MAIYDTMQYILCRCFYNLAYISMAASMGAFLFGRRHKREKFALPNAEVILHQPSTEEQRAKQQKFCIHPESILKTKRKWNEILAWKYTGKSVRKKSERDTERGNFMSALKEAKETWFD